MLNWDTRYANLLASSGAELELGTVLEVGCGPHGIARYLRNEVTGLEVGPVQPEPKNLRIVEGSITDIPFPDNSFDFVICSDVLEHLPAASRAHAIAESVRVARKKCFIQGPHGNISLGMEVNLANTMRRHGMNPPAWLQEHLLNGLPGAGETMAGILKTGFVPVIRTNEGIIEHYAAVVADCFFQALSLFQKNAGRKGTLSQIRSAAVDVPYSLLFEVSKDRMLGIAMDPFSAQLRSVADKGLSGREAGASGTTIFSVHHRHTGLAEHFRLIKVFDVTGKLAGADISLERPQGFFEERNDRCSEMSAIHYVWKRQLFGDVVGFCHYRRFLYPFPEDTEEAEIKVDAGKLATLLPRIEDSAQIRSLLARYHLLTARPESIGQASQVDQYADAHFVDDYLKMTECIVERFPFLADALTESMDATALYSTNMLICSGTLFDLFCRIWFDILGHCAEKLDPAGRDAYQVRDIAFLSERVFDTLIRHLKRLGYEIGELPRVFVASWDARDAVGSVPRNRPCPCGSGKRYKHCCGAPD